MTTAHAQPEAIRGVVFTRSVRLLSALAVIGGVLIVWRFLVGLGRATALTDGYPWGLWIAFDVVTGTALGCGGYAVALLVFVLNRGRYHPVLRPALVTSAFGYSIAAFSVMIDVGRPWLAWKIPVFFWHWNLRSVLLEVALCIMAYALVLWIELAPAFLERAQTSSVSVIRRLAEAWLPVLRKALPWVAALGLLLPTMHQSGLGTLLLLSGPRLHPLWNTIMLPLLFLTSCIAMGFGMVVIESALSARVLGRRPEIAMLAGLGGAMRPVVLVYLSIRIVDLIVRDQINDLFALDWFSVMSLIEFGLLFGALALLREERQRRDLGNLFRASMLLLLGGALYRFDVFLLAFQPGANWAYFPNVAEILITVGLVAAEIVGYVILINLFPILAGRPRSAVAR